MEHIKSLDEFNNLIKENKIVVIDFYATWCGPCKMLSPIVEEISNENNNIKVVKVDVDEAGELANMFAIYAVPTIAFIKEETLFKRHEGFMEKEDFQEIIDAMK